MVMGRRVPNIGEGMVRRVEALLEEFGARVSATSPGFFKMPVTDERVRPQLREEFPRALELTRRLGADRMILFGFLRPDGAPQDEAPPGEAVQLLGGMAERAAGMEVLCLLENEAICYGDTGLRAAAFIRAVDHPNLRLNWDPGNSVHAGSTCPYPDEYDEVKDLVAHLHVKDMAQQQGKLVTVVPGEGIIEWSGQLSALWADGYEGFVTVETHFGPKVAASRQSVAWVREMLEALGKPRCEAR
jgi:sugar phosphate isomerase/epimerase